MINNVQSLNARAKKFALENNLSVRQIMQNYMFERFLERLSKSEYKEKFIIKGGLLLSSIMGLNVRTTMDDLKAFADIIKQIQDDEWIKTRWDDYRQKHLYATPLKFEDVISKIRFVFEKLDV